ncbi:hypothetical protein [Bradyrhizobium erythrophlei]|uniref:Uncharacterized protein n=1 Tax=Bradyrhizobium erythrophlei TaxID=1437360 RepID=A0A1M7T770_9BRAD|nr:hypothetical protein [Bradyrhizobium erythrophlei]SHN66517.1 hypothetical protein SAMN05444170_0969 [Bradyrhizobium erythrophlei]
MPTLSIEGHSVNVDDSFLKLSPDEQNATVDEIHKSLTAGAPQSGFDRNDKRFSEGAMSAQKALEGVPVLGAAVPKVGAYLSALAHPITGVGADGASISERAAKNLEQEKAASETYDKENPIASTAAKMVGGTLALAPLGATGVGAKALGLTGTLPGMMVRGATSGAVLGGADAAVRGENVGSGIEFGAGGGIAGPLIGRAVGKTASAIADRFRPAATTPMNTVKIGSTEVPLTQSQVTQNPAASAEEQILLRGGRGDQAQEVAQSHADLQDTRVNQAKDEIGQGLNPAAPTPVTPHVAGEQVASELSQAEQARQAARAIQNAALEAQHGNIAASLDPSGQSATVLPSRAGEIISDAARREASTAIASEQAANQALQTQQQATRAGLAQGANLAENTHHAAEITSQAVRDAAEAARARTRAAYEAMRQMPGEFEPAGFRNAGQSIRQRLSAGESPVYVNSSTPMAEQALGIIDHQVGGARFPNAAEPNRPLVRNASGSVGPAPRPITPSSVEEVRKQLIGLASDARSAAMRTGVQSDVRAMRGIINAFDNHVRDVVGAGGFSGDGQAFLNQLQTARQLHSDYRNTFTSQGGGDKVGRVLEDIIGRNGVDPAPAPRVAQVMYGPEARPGGAQAVQVAQRLRQIFGENSPEWAAYKQGLFSHLTEGPTGRGPGEIADRIESFLGGTHSQALSQVAFTPEERAALQQYATAARNRVQAPRAATDTVGRTLEKIVGEGGQPATPQGVAETLFGRSGLGDSQTATKLAQHIRDTHGANSPEFTAVRQGMWHSITEAPGGMLARDPAQIADRIAEHINGRGKSTADVLYSPAEKARMLAHADNLRASAAKAPGDEVDRVIAKISGRDGGMGASPTEVADYLYGRTGAGDRGISVRLAQRLKGQISPEGWDSVRQGMWTKLTEPTEGRLDWGPQKISERLHEFLNGNGKALSHVLFTSQERELMQKLAGVYKQMIPVKGTTNPSGTAPMLAKIAGGARHALLPLLGFSHGGVPGAAVAVGIDKALTSLANAKAARNATKLFYGAQPRRAVDPRFTRAGGLAGQVIGGPATSDRATAPPAPLALSPPPIRQMTPGARR